MATGAEALACLDGGVVRHDICVEKCGTPKEAGVCLRIWIAMRYDITHVWEVWICLPSHLDGDVVRQVPELLVEGVSAVEQSAAATASGSCSRSSSGG